MKLDKELLETIYMQAVAKEEWGKLEGITIVLKMTGEREFANKLFDKYMLSDQPKKEN